MNYVLIHMYRTIKVDMSEYFIIYELIQFMLVIRRIIAQEIQNSGGQCEVENYLFYHTIYFQMYKIVYSSSNTEFFY